MVARYLFSAGHAISERQRWQNRTMQEIQFIVLEKPNRTWATTVNIMMRDIEALPPMIRSWLLALDPDDPEEVMDQLARTIGTMTYNAHVLTELALNGITHKQWVTRQDAKVRPSHARANGQVVPLSRPFEVGGQQMQFPADSRTATMDEWASCRCVLLGRRS